jgi:gliding motility-associated-like protein
VKDTAVITVPPPINVVFTIVNNKCFDSCTGTASAVATGGVRPYTYKWNTNPLSISDTIINLCAGSYTLTVTDSNGISVANTITITAPTPITMIVDSTPITCNGANNGTLKDSAVAGGTSPYTITWSASTSGTNPITGLSPGTYYVTVTDANNCIATDSASLGQPTPVTATITATDSVKCFGQNNGIAMVLAGGGRPPYAYQWSGSASVTDSATDLIAGPQTVTVTDASGCTATASFSIDQPLQIIVTITTTPAHCATSNDGTATAIVSNGTPPYTYTWDAAAPGTNSTISSLASGPHTLTVTDVNGCFTQQTFTIDTLYVLHISLVADSVTCYGGHNGDATVTVANGNPNFTYVWRPSGDATNPATGLSAGVQTVTVTDSYRCTAIDSIPVYQPAQIVVSHSFINPLCYGDRNGKIWLSAAGGSGSYTYTYLGTSHPMTDTLTGLPSGTYIITVTDTKGCTQNDTVTLADPAKLQMYASQTAITCANAANGIIHVGATGGTPAYTFSWSTGGNSDTVRNNLPPGVYVITVTDANGCTSDTTETLIAPPPIIVIALTADSTSCPDSADGHISITVTGGTPGTAVLYQYSLNNGTWQTSSDFYDLAAGSYQVHARDSQLCQLDTSISVGQPLPVTVGINPLDTSIIVGSSMQLTTLLGGFTTQTINSYSWSPATGLSCIDCANPVATPYQTTQYQLVLNYGKNCTSKANASIEIEHGPDTYIPNAFTPNGDDVNDEFSVFGTKIKSVSMRIFNRWGEKVFDSDDSQWAVWDGTYKGVGQPAGVYVYVAQIVYLDDVKKTREGSVTLIR